MMISKAPIPKFSFPDRIKLAKIGIFKWKIPTYTTGEELIMLNSLAKKLEPESVAVEIGSYIGASSVLIAKGLSQDSKLYCIDTWQNDAMTEGKWDSYSEFEKNTKSVSKLVVPLRENSYKAALNFNKEIDFIFIDGDHSYEGVKSDVELWLPKLKSDGIVVMHDIGWAEGVIKVINEIVEPNMSKSNRLPNMYWGWKK